MMIKLWKSPRENYDILIEIILEFNTFRIHLKENSSTDWSPTKDQVDVFNPHFWNYYINQFNGDTLEELKEYFLVETNVKIIIPR